MDLEQAKLKFEEYIKDYDMNVKEINLKYHHSYKVMELMGELAFRLNLTDEDLKLAKLIGLLHDIGRFEQIKRFGTFNDRESIDHADFSCVYLFDEGHIRDFIEDSKYDEIIKKSIKNHNKKEIDETITDEKELLFCKMIRDMDKVDIYRVCAIFYPHEFNASDVTEEVLKAFKDEEQIDLTKRKTKTDATLIQLGFIFDINFNESFDILVETDNFDFYLSVVEVDKNSENLWKKVRELCFDKINRGVIEC